MKLIPITEVFYKMLAIEYDAHGIYYIRGHIKALYPLLYSLVRINPESAFLFMEYIFIFKEILLCINFIHHSHGYTKEFVSITENERVLLKDVTFKNRDVFGLCIFKLNCI